MPDHCEFIMNYINKLYTPYTEYFDFSNSFDHNINVVYNNIIDGSYYSEFSSEKFHLLDLNCQNIIYLD